MKAGVEFTAAQLEAIDVSKSHLDACVVAGPGSGKTTVLVEYFRRLVEQGVDPLRILAITFTEKAAGNMRKKLAEAFQDRAAVRARLERAWVSTVHGFCARLLRENAVFAAVDPEFQVADVRDAARLQNEAIHAAIDELFAEHPAAVRRLIRGLSSYEFEDAVLSAYDAMRGAGVRVEQLAGFEAPAGVTLADLAGTLGALAAERVTQWNPAQKLQLRSALEGAERIVSAASAGEALAGHRGVLVQPEQVQTRERRLRAAEAAQGPDRGRALHADHGILRGGTAAAAGHPAAVRPAVSRA